jgi:hypothetical protein
MSHGQRLAPLILACCLLTRSPAVAREKEEVQPQNLYTLDLRARLPAEKDFTDASPSLAVHVFRDGAGGHLFYVAADGKALAVVAVGKDAADDGKKAPKRLHRLLLPVREWDEKTFGDKTAKVSVEVYRDENNGNLVYFSHTGFVAVVKGPKDVAKEAKEPKWLDRLPLKVRQRDDDFDRALLRDNVEVYLDQNAGCVVYVAANGSIAVISLATTDEGKESRGPVWDHAVGSRVRAYDEADFTEKTAEFSAEVYLDDNRGVRLYATDKLYLAAMPGGKAKEPDKVKPLEWKGQVRPKEAKDGVKWCSEVFVNPNNDDLLFITAGGALALAR